MDPHTKSKIDDLYAMARARETRDIERREALYRLAWGAVIVLALGATMLVVWKAMEWMT